MGIEWKQAAEIGLPLLFIAILIVAVFYFLPKPKPKDATTISARDLRGILNVSEPSGYYIVERTYLSKGAGFFILLLIIYNVVMGIWLFIGTSGAIQETVIALMWIGGNQTLGFVIAMSRHRMFEVRRAIQYPQS